MDFEISEEDKMAVAGLKRCVEAKVLPLIKSERDKAFSPELAHELMSILNPCGIGAGWLPEDGGGMGLSYLTSGMLYGELARLAPDVAGLAYVSEGAVMKIYRCGTAEQKARYLPGMAEGRIIGCGAVTEPGTGSNVRQLRTKAVRDGDGWRLSGEKMFISNATVADISTVIARTGEDEFTIFILDRAAHKFESRELEKLGLNGWSFGSIVLDNVYIGDEFRHQFRHSARSARRCDPLCDRTRPVRGADCDSSARTAIAGRYGLRNRGDAASHLQGAYGA